MRIYIIRHGETDWNTIKRLQGRSDIELNDQGRRLARITAEALKDVEFSRIYTSPLKRAKETALIMKRDREIPIIEEPRIIEMSFGIYEGLCSGRDYYTIPDPNFSFFFTQPERYIPPEGAESIAELCKRTTEFLHELVHNQDMKEDTVLISTHGAALMGLLSSVHKRGIAGFWGDGVHKNCAVTILEVTKNGISILEEGKIFY